jgi:hypothetical protein
MIGDPDRGLNYELAIALAPPRTQLLLLSGSVGNPREVANWLRRLGREPVLISHHERPVPLEEVHPNSLSYSVPSEIRGYWPRLAAKALAEDLGPILIFAPRRQAAESMAAELARYLPTPNPLALTSEQKLLVGDHLAKMLKSRIAFHHSGLSYAVRAGVIEPLAKAGQLRVVVATMGLAAGINFSLRSVALAGSSYRRDYVEQPIKPDEILQMFGRAGRRGLDEVGYVLITPNELRLLDGQACQLARGGLVDWSALLGLMSAAAQAERDPFTEAVRVQERLFTTKPIFLGVEESLKHPEVPCGLKTDPERARHVRKRFREILNSRGVWEPAGTSSERPLKEIFAPVRPPRSEETSRAPFELGSPVLLRPALSEPAALEKVGTGTLVVLDGSAEQPVYGRAFTVAERLHDERVLLTKWIRRLTHWGGRQVSAALWKEKVAPLIEARLRAQRFPLVRFVESGRRIVAEVSLAEQTLRVTIDSHGEPLWQPIDREVLPSDCARCALVPVCRKLPAGTGTALLWRRLGLVDAAGVPTRRGRVVSFFTQGDGLAIAAAIEDDSYPLGDLLYDLANLDAGFRFCADENRWAGRLAQSCHQAYGMQSVAGYLENGLPPKYGAGAEQVVQSVHKNPATKHLWVTDLVGPGDIDRIFIEWRSLLRRVAHAPEIEWPRWTAFQQLARETLNETTSPTLTELPPLEYHQTRRVDHRLILRRH